VTIHFDSNVCRNFDAASALEWYATNGMGGYAGGTVAGVNTRKYHGYLVVAAHPPVQRFVVLSRVEDRAIVGNAVTDLSSNEFVDIIHPQGYRNLLSFEIGDTGGPVWRYQVGDAVIEKSLVLVHGQDTAIVKYELITPPKNNAAVRLQVQPMLAGRDFHATIQLYHRPWWTLNAETPDCLTLKAPECPVALSLSHNAEKFSTNACWWYNFTFRVERTRGYPDREDLWTPGVLEFSLTPGKPVGFIASTKPIAWSKHEELTAQARARYAQLKNTFAEITQRDELLTSLGIAADQFVVQRGTAGGVGGSPGTSNRPMSVIAGYPWFEDWGRDTFISLCGLTLVTGRFDIARSILVTFADHMKDGLLPNRFPDKAYKPDYNTVDAAMWFVHAAYQYWRYSGDVKLLREYLYRPLCQIIEKYASGTDFGIKMDADGLIRAGSHGHQLTWMDAKVGDWVVTPRHGKPVEINALWYNNLRIMTNLARLNGDNARAEKFAGIAQQVANSFPLKFFNEQTSCLFDYIDDNGRGDGAVRPNQLVAVALPFSPLSAAMRQKIVEACQRQLLTPMGLRTLAPGSMGYHGRCAGDQRARDMAYHQGTVWPWLIGPFISAYVKVNGNTIEARKKAREFITPFEDHLQHAGLGSISEIADGEPPHTPRGTPAQAWSVAEVLRVYYEDVLNLAPLWPHEQPTTTAATPPSQSPPKVAV